jgi:ABC-type branched-subunit amino acid transport system ATPase component/ABC-type branched-subunit amino acid transport system permease subunit
VIETTGAAATAAARRRGPLLRRPERPVPLAVTAVLVLFVVLGLPQFMSLYYTGYMTLAAIYAIVSLGLALLVGRVGLFSLGQAAVLQLGAWVGARLLFATNQPFPIVLVEAGLVTMLIGTAIGLPALRLRGLYLALITLMLAGAITVILATVNFPNGGGGFTGYNGNAVHIPPIRRPSIAASDGAYFRYAAIAAIIMFALVIVHLRSRPGRAWAAIRQSEPAALAAGINTTLYKLWAFALASFITGVAGGLLAGESHYLYSINFTTQDSITLLAVVLMGGVYNLWGAVIAALLLILLADHLVRHRHPADADDSPNGHGRPVARPRQADRGASSGRRPAQPDVQRTGRRSPMIVVDNLTVRYGGVTSLDGLSLTFEQGICGLIGPNGAGKTTFFNVVSGFVRPASGTVTAFGDNLLALPHFKRARWGVRRTFQTEQAISGLTVFDNVAMITSPLRGAARRADVFTAIEFTGLGAKAAAKVGTLSAGERRLVEVARAVAGQPRLILLDEPAAGLPDEETAHLTSVIQAIPGQTGALTILVDHDMSLVSAVCETTAVLDFGKLIASGPTASVLRDEHVMRAYLGTAEV